RFFQLDPSRQEVNPYAYVAGNPLRYSDPSGLICVDGVDKWPYHVAPCASGWDFGESAWSEASSQLQAFSYYLFTQGGAALIPYIAGMELGGNFILRQHRLMNYDRYYAGAEGGDIAYAEDFFTQVEAAGRFELAAMQVADVATPLSELGLASRAMSCGDDVMRVVIIEALDGDGYYDDLGRRIEQTLVDGDSLTWQYDFQPMAQYGAPNIRMQLSSSRAIAPIDKFRHYIFKPGATHGKDRVFRSLGYGAEDSALLARIYEEQAWTNFQQGKYSLGRLDQYGQRINIEIILEGV